MPCKRKGAGPGRLARRTHNTTHKRNRTQRCGILQDPRAKGEGEVNECCVVIDNTHSGPKHKRCALDNATRGGREQRKQQRVQEQSRGRQRPPKRWLGSPGRSLRQAVGNGKWRDAGLNGKIPSRRRASSFVASRYACVCVFGRVRRKRNSHWTPRVSSLTGGIRQGKPWQSSTGPGT